MGSDSAVRLARRGHTTPIPNEGATSTPPEPSEFRFRVNHPSRLRPHRVEAIEVSLAPLRPINRALDLRRKKTGASMPLRLLVPGAVVTPAEHAVEPSPFESIDVVFHVMPLADGPLSGARLEVLRQGQVETIPLALNCESTAPVRLLAALAVLIPILLSLPACWPEFAENGSVENSLREWLPNVPGLSSTVAHVVQAAYDFLAGPARDLKISFFAFVGLAAAAAIWALICRPQQVVTKGQSFEYVFKSGPGDNPPLLAPASVDEVQAIAGGH
jgi:hypothetical protein